MLFIEFQFFLLLYVLLQSYSISIHDRFSHANNFNLFILVIPGSPFAYFLICIYFTSLNYCITIFSSSIFLFSIFLFIMPFPFDLQKSLLSLSFKVVPISSNILLGICLFPEQMLRFLKVFNSMFYNINQKMNSENVWVMFYVVPQFNCFPILEVKPQSNLPLQKVEIQNQERNNEMVQEISLPKHDIRYQKATHSSRIQFRESEDSSFYVPEKQEAKIGQQKLGRNSVSNILRVFTKLLKTPYFRGKYQKLKQYYGVQISWKQFNSWVTGIGLNTNKYIRIKRMLNGIKSKPHFGRLLCILFKIFVSSFSRSAILTSSKTEVKNIIPSLSQIRNIQQEIIQALSQSLYQIQSKKENGFD